MLACRGCHSAVTHSVLCHVVKLFWIVIPNVISCRFQSTAPIFPIIQKTLVWAILASSDGAAGAGGWCVVGTLEAWHQMSPGHPWSLAMVRVRGSNSVTGLIMPSLCQVNRGYRMLTSLHSVNLSSLGPQPYSGIRDTIQQFDSKLLIYL